MNYFSLLLQKSEKNLTFWRFVCISYVQCTSLYGVCIYKFEKRVVIFKIALYV